MDKIEKIRQEIERRKNYISVTHFAEELLSFLDTLSEEPDKSLEEAAKEYAEGPECTWVGTTALEEAFKAGAEWQKQQMMRSPLVSVGYTASEELQRINYENGRKDMREQMLKDAVECELYWDGDFLAIDLNMMELGYSERDKVKVIVLKAEKE